MKEREVKATPSDEFEKLLEHDGLTFVDSSIEELPQFTRSVIEEFLKDRIPWKICTTVLNNGTSEVRCFSVEDSWVKYINVYEQEECFFFVDEGHHNSLPINEVIIQLLKAERTKEGFNSVEQKAAERIFEIIDKSRTEKVRAVK
jgi:hypothetical protein